MKLPLTVSIATLAAFTPLALAEADSHADAKTKLEKDRQAILAMAGEYKVSFQFMETVPLVAGYEFFPPKTSGATEFVEVISDEGNVIDMQHVLVMGKGDESMVVKHWRQAWVYEDSHLTTFKGDNTWETRALSAEETAGKWTQFVYQVDDSPRYEGIGEWTHEGGVSAWESEETWRPLPRRERTVRSDYQVMGCVNRHTLTPTGWVHEQDNSKIVLADDGSIDKVLVREVGLNIYDRMGEGIADGQTHDFSAGREYWDSTSSFWADVREAWSDKLDVEGTVALKKKVDDKTLWQHMFIYAADIADGDTAYDEAEVEVFITETLAAFDATRQQSASAAE